MIQLTLGTVIATLPVSIQADDSIVELAPFLVKSNGVQNMLQITERDLSQRQAADLEDALSIDPSITVGGSTGVAQKIYVRNLGEGLLNISVDGATQTGSLFHHIGRISIEPELLKQVDVQAGIGSVTDGPGALGGSIKFVTKDPSDLLRQDQNIGGMVRYGYYDNTEGYKASANLYGRFNDNWSGLFSYVSSDYNNILDGDGNELLGSNSQQISTMTKVVGEFEDGQTIRFSYEQIDEKGEKLQRPEWGYVPWNSIFPMKTKRDTVTLGYQFDSQDINWFNLDANLSHNEANVVQNGRWGIYEGIVESTQFSLSNSIQSERNDLVFGFDYREDEVSIVAPEGSGETSNPETGDVLGIFVQDNFYVTEDLQLTLGLRFDSYSLKDANLLSFDDEDISPTFALTYSLTPEITVKASSASAYRGQEVNDAFAIGVSTNDPNMIGESAQNNEISFTYNNSNVTFEAGLFENTIDDVITTSIPWKKNYSNVGKLETDGVFARASYRGNNWNLSLLYNQADTTLNGLVATRYEYGSIVSSIGDTWVIDAFWQVSEQIDIGWNLRLVEAIDSISIPERYASVPDASITKPGYSTHDFFVRWSPTFNDNLSFNLTIKNAFDKTYRSHGSVENLENIPDFEGVIGAYEPGRDIRLSAAYRF